MLKSFIDSSKRIPNLYVREILSYSRLEEECLAQLKTKTLKVILLSHTWSS